MADNVKYDVDGYELITVALRSLIANYPGLSDGESFGFSELPKTFGQAIFPSAGAAIQTEVESITGHVTQMCIYPFSVLYRASGMSQNRKVNVKEWLDDFGRWLSKQPIKVDGVEYKLESYPELSGTRKIKEISRQTPAYLSTTNEDKSEDWIMDVQVLYRNEFDR